MWETGDMFSICSHCPIKTNRLSSELVCTQKSQEKLQCTQRVFDSPFVCFLCPAVSWQKLPVFCARAFTMYSLCAGIYLHAFPIVTEHLHVCVCLFVVPPSQSCVCVSAEHKAVCSKAGKHPPQRASHTRPSRPVSAA